MAKRPFPSATPQSSRAAKLRELESFYAFSREVDDCHLCVPNPLIKRAKHPENSAVGCVIFVIFVGRVSASLISVGHVSIEAADAASITRALTIDEMIMDRNADYTTVLVPITLPMRGGRRLVVPSAQRSAQPDPILVAALRKAHSMLKTERGMPIVTCVPTSPYDSNLLRLAFLAPDIQRAFLEGRQPHHLNLETLKKIRLPLSWVQQRAVLGFPEAGNPCSAD